MVAEFFRYSGFSRWADIPTGEYAVPVDKYTVYYVTINQDADESDPGNCHVSIRKMELLYFGGFFQGLD